MPEAFSSPPASKETASERFRHESRHVRHARAVMHVAIANHGGGENVPGILGACATLNFEYLVRGPFYLSNWPLGDLKETYIGNLLVILVIDGWGTSFVILLWWL